MRAGARRRSPPRGKLLSPPHTGGGETPPRVPVRDPVRGFLFPEPPVSPRGYRGSLAPTLRIPAAAGASFPAGDGYAGNPSPGRVKHAWTPRGGGGGGTPSPHAQPRSRDGSCGRGKSVEEGGVRGEKVTRAINPPPPPRPRDRYLKGFVKERGGNRFSSVFNSHGGGFSSRDFDPWGVLEAVGRRRAEFSRELGEEPAPVICFGAATCP